MKSKQKYLLMSGTLFMLLALTGIRTACAAKEVTAAAMMAPGPVVQAVSAPRDAPLGLASAVAIALQGNPGLAVIEARVAALEQVPGQKGTLPDPRLLFNIMNLPVDTFSLSQEAMTQVQIGITQMLPFPGKLALQEEVAAFKAAVASKEVDEMRLRLARDVKTLWWTLFYLDRSLEIVQRNQALLRQLVTIALTKYKVGKGLQQDVLLAQVELSKLLDKEIALKGARRSWAARLNALLGQAVNRPVQLAEKVKESLPRPLAEARLYRLADESRPLFTALDKRIAAARARLDLARKDYYPDFRLGAAYGFRRGVNPDGNNRADFATFMFSMNLPIHTASRLDKKVDQRTSELDRERYALTDERSRVETAISMALADYERARGQVELFRDGIIPQATQTVASMRAGYQVNKVDFLNLVRAQITLFNYETQYWKALSEANQALAKLTAAVGKETVYE